MSLGGILREWRTGLSMYVQHVEGLEKTRMEISAATAEALESLTANSQEVAPLYLSGATFLSKTLELKRFPVIGFLFT